MINGCRLLVLDVVSTLASPSLPHLSLSLSLFVTQIPHPFLHFISVEEPISKEPSKSGNPLHLKTHLGPRQDTTEPASIPCLPASAPSTTLSTSIAAVTGEPGPSSVPPPTQHIDSHPQSEFPFPEPRFIKCMGPPP